MTGRRPRRTAEQVQVAIRDAVAAELAASGYAAVTFEGIARRANVSKPVLYRRYSDRASMVLDAMKSAGAAAEPQAQSSGSLREDLIAVMSASGERVTHFGADAYRALVGEVKPETLEQVAGMVVDTTSLLQNRILEPARERGELGPLPIDPEVVMAPLRLLRHRLIFTGVTAPDVADIVDKIALPLFRAASGLTQTDQPVDWR